MVLNVAGAGHEIDVIHLTVKAGEGVSLGSNENKLENVYLDVSGGGILIGNGNTGNDALKVSIKSGVDTLTNDITIHNYNNKVSGEDGNDIHVTVPISAIDATLGKVVDVPTVYGDVALTIPDKPTSKNQMYYKV